ncbi:cyclohexanecarboxylate-CoA ligase [Sphingopyxis lindanitolerans]|uniref:Cyclohexanecarboxylate-CoA ligase n=1 Tax=Sphingopyxis lindanitolerans TaxID=2054227 RepID=A0A2S8B3W5_9SPHN|nr:AMP-binding protein [Sphingopyxis lindanitolerans]PQM26959.1 cyclohexanecarboxylate-CoA ligase [Sphingopyxis lindanitolerans]
MIGAAGFRRDTGGWQTRWDPERARRAVRDGDWSNRTIADFAADRVAATPDRVLLFDGDHALTCRDLHDRACRLAGYFDAIGLAPGQVVSFQLPNWWECSVINLAAAMTGVVVNPIVPINRDAEVTFMLGESRSRLMFVPATFRGFDYAAMMARIAPDLPAAPEVIIVRGAAEGCPTFDAILAGEPLTTARQVDPDAVKLLMYTSGTTGRPKGVLHSHNSIGADSIKMAAAMALGASDVTFSPSPVTHVSGFLWALNGPWIIDVPAVTVDIWEPERALDLVKAHRCTFMLGATPFLQDFLAVARVRNEAVPSLRYFLCGGASVPPELILDAARQFPNCIPFRTFGATEVPTMTAGPASRDGLRLAAETDGRLLHCEVKIVDAGPDGEGEILARELSMALGYARPEDNEDAYDDEGFFRTGDLGRLVEGDHIVCTGRKKDLIIRAGENISAREIEDVLFASPLIAEVAVVSMPSRRTGEAICAFIVPADDASIDLGDVIDLVSAAGLARQKTPEHLMLVRDLPKTASGKVRKDQLRLIAAGEVLEKEQAS